MFTFAVTPVKFVGLLLMFAWCVGWGVYELSRPQTRTRRVSGSLHLAMSVLMMAMVAPQTWQPIAPALPLWTALFALATVWFGRLAWLARGGHDLAPTLGHTAMFLAMTWHLGAMAVMRPMRMAAASAGPGAMPGMGATPSMGAMPGMGQGGSTMSGMAAASAPGGVLWVFALVGVPLMAYLLIAGLNDVRRALLPRPAAAPCHCGPDCGCGPHCTCDATLPASEEVLRHQAQDAAASGRTLTVIAPAASSCHAVRPIGTPGYRAQALADAAMNLGMFWMSTGLLLPVAGFMAAFAI